LTHPAGPWGPSGPLVDPAAAKLLQIWPLPNIPNANGPGFNPSNESNYYALETLGFHVYHIDSRFDAVLSSKDSVFVTWSRSVGDNTNSGGIPPAQLYIQNVDDRANLVTVNYAHVFNPRLTNEFIFGMGHGATVTQPPGELSYLNSRSNPFNSLFQNTGPGVTRGVLAVNVPGYASPGFGEIFRAENKTFQISDNLDWIHGRQTLAAGMNYFRKGEYDWDFIRYVNFASPAFSAGGFDQGYVGGDSMADLLMGIPADIHQRFNFVGGDATAPEANEAFPYWGFYINDKVRINPKLTLSLGLRYDLDIPLFAYNNL
jgi:hypothetical protein